MNPRSVISVLDFVNNEKSVISVLNFVNAESLLISVIRVFRTSPAVIFDQKF